MDIEFVKRNVICSISQRFPQNIIKTETMTETWLYKKCIVLILNNARKIILQFKHVGKRNNKKTTFKIALRWEQGGKLYANYMQTWLSNHMYYLWK